MRIFPLSISSAMATIMKTMLCLSLFALLTAADKNKDQTIETCAALDLVGMSSEDSEIEAKQDTSVSITFELTTQNCSYSPKMFLVTVSYLEEEEQTPVCTVAFKRKTCSVGNLISSCRCTQTDRSIGYIDTHVNRKSLRYRLEWTDSSRINTEREKSVLITITSTSNNALIISMAVLCPAMVIIIIVAVVVWIRRKRRAAGGHLEGRIANYLQLAEKRMSSLGAAIRRRSAFI